MNNRLKLIGCLAMAMTLTACQNSSKPFNGSTGYQVESQTANSATIAYTLSGRQDRNDRKKDEQKLQSACQKVLGSHQNYRISLLSSNEIANPNAIPTEHYGRQIGNSRTSIGLSNTPDLYNNENLATREALDTRPATLRVIRYTCSV